MKKIIFLMILFNQICFAEKEPSQIVLQRFALQEAQYPHCGMSLVTFLPGQVKSAHVLNGSEVGFVLQGELFLKPQGRPVKVIHAGESFQIPSDVIHTTTAGSKGAKVIATWMLKD